MSSEYVTDASSVSNAGHRIPRSFDSAVLRVARRELRSRIFAFVVWVSAAGAMLAMSLAMQPTMAKSGSLMEQKLAAMPEEMRTVFGLDQIQLSDPASYLASNLTLYLLLGALFVGLSAARAIAHEQASGTAELLFSRPVSRAAILGGKALAGLTLAAAWNAALLAISLVVYTAAGVEVEAPGTLAAIFVAATAIHAALYALSLAATQIPTSFRSASGVALGVIFGSYGLGVVAALSEKLHGLRWLSPFRYGEPSATVAAAGLTTQSLWLVVATVAALWAALVLFQRRDIST